MQSERGILKRAVSLLQAGVNFGDKSERTEHFLLKKKAMASDPGLKNHSKN